MTRRVSVEAVEEEEKEQLEVDVPVMSVQEGQICSMLVDEFVSEENKDPLEEVDESGDPRPCDCWKKWCLFCDVGHWWLLCFSYFL